VSAQRWAALVFTALLAGGVVAATTTAEARSFTADRSVLLLSPAPLSTVTTPFTVAWTAPRHQHGRWAVFVDATPIAPGHSLRDLASPACKRQPACWPASDELSAQGVYVTASDRVEVSSLEPPGGIGGQAAHPVHTATLVALDRSGRYRVGAEAWEVEFRE